MFYPLTPADLADAQALLGPHARFLARGATCAVYTDGCGRVVRLALTPEAQLAVQAGLQRALAAAGGRVAAVHGSGWLATSATSPGQGRAYSLEKLLRGDDSDPSEAGWAELGHTLRLLHGLPCAGYGLLLDQPGEFVGCAATPPAGLLTRLCRAWPFDGLPLASQPLVQAAPGSSGLAAALTCLEVPLRRVLTRESVICHTDLHANQLVWQGGRLAGLLDFGDCTVAPAAWDSASLAYFQGWEVLALTGLETGAEVALFGLLLAMHRAKRAQDAGKPAQLARAVAFAWECVARL